MFIRGASVTVRAVAPVFFASGAVALACETVYFRWLGLLFGASHEATGALLACFMLGLAVGAELGARGADTLERPLFAYALLEGVIGGYTALVPSLVSLVRDAVTPLGSGPRLLLSFALLALPTAAMGATLPILCAATADAIPRERTLARLYAINVAGGVAGALFASLLVTPRLGVRGTTYAVAAAGLAVAASALALSVRAAPAPHAGLRKWQARSGEPGSEPEERVSPSTATALFVALLVGTLSFALQVLENRVLSLLLGSSAHTFALVVAVILAGTALGGARGIGTVESEADVYRRVGAACLKLAIAVFLGIIIVHVAPFYLSLMAERSSMPLLGRAIVVILVAGPPSYQIGALFPVLATRLPRRADVRAGAGAVAGRAVVLTTLANVGGALLASFVAIPALGVRHAFLLVAAAPLAGALFASHRAGAVPFRGMVVGVALAVAVGFGLAPAWDVVSLSAGTYRTALYRRARRTSHESECGPRRELPRNRVLFHEDGALGTVVVMGHDDPKGGAPCALYSLRVNGKTEGSVFVRAPLSARVPERGDLVPAGDLPSEVVAGLLPALLGDRTDVAFLVGWGTGLSTRALLDAGAGRVESAELEPAVLRAARLFEPAALVDPRVHVSVADARIALLRAAPGAFDVVVSHPSNPWVEGASALFSREYFQLIRSRLRPGGRALAWIQLYEIDRDAVRTLVATFLTAFPESHAFRASPDARDLFLVGVREDTGAVPLDVHARFLRAGGEGGAERAERAEGVRRALAAAGLSGEAARARAYLGGPATLARYAAGARVEEELGPEPLEVRVAAKVLAGEEDSAAEILRGLGDSPAP